MNVKRDSQLRSDDASDLGGLVVAALTESRSVQRHGDERIRVLMAALERCGKQEPQCSAERPRAVELQSLHLGVERRPVDKRGDERIDLPHAAQPWTTLDGSGQAAPGARPLHGDEVERATGTKAADRRTAAAWTQLRRERSQPGANRRCSFC